MKVHIMELGVYTCCGRKLVTGMRVLMGLGNPSRHKEICRQCLKKLKGKK